MGSDSTTESDVVRRLTAVLAADVAGYSRLMGADAHWMAPEDHVLQEPHIDEAAPDRLIADLRKAL